MCIQIQYDLFEPLTEVDELKMEIKAVHESSTKVRKALFARNNELAKNFIELSQRLEIIERNICHGK